MFHGSIYPWKITQPGFHLGAHKKGKVTTKTIFYKICIEILFQKVALGYLLHFVQNESSKNILKTYFVAHQTQKSASYTARLPFGSTTKT